MTMQKYNRLKQEISKLQIEAEKARRSAVRSAIQQIKSIMSEYGITLANLQDQPGLGRRKKMKSTGSKSDVTVKPRGKVAPKYRSRSDPNITWTGRGRTPKWVTEWIGAGNKIEDLLIK